MHNAWAYGLFVLLANYLQTAVPIFLLLVIINWSMFSSEYCSSLSHLFNLTRENVFSIHTAYWTELQRIPSTIEFCKEEIPPRQKADWTKAMLYCFKTGSSKYWTQSYLHQNFLWLCKNNVALGIYSDKH